MLMQLCLRTLTVQVWVGWQEMQQVSLSGLRSFLDTSLGSPSSLCGNTFHPSTSSFRVFGLCQFWFGCGSKRLLWFAIKFRLLVDVNPVNWSPLPPHFHCSSTYCRLFRCFEWMKLIAWYVPLKTIWVIHNFLDMNEPFQTKLKQPTLRRSWWRWR